MEQEDRMNEKQVAFMNDLFAGDTYDLDLLTKHNITTDTYYQWLIDDDFCWQLNRRLLALNRRTALLIAIKASQAAVKLLSLLDCDKKRIVRQVCLDIINVPILKNDDNESEDTDVYNSQCPRLSDETASILLKALAKGEQTEN